MTGLILLLLSLAEFVNEHFFVFLLELNEANKSEMSTSQVKT